MMSYTEVKANWLQHWAVLAASFGDGSSSKHGSHWACSESNHMRKVMTGSFWE
jgi:hypothetical protein